MIENSITNPYLKSLAGTITRTFYLDPEDANYSDRWNRLRDIYDSHSHYFSSKEIRRAGEECWPLEADSMIGIYRMTNIYKCLKEVIENGVEGDFVETGVWKGGACVYANAVIHEYNEQAKRKVHVFDSFEGLPAPYMSEDAGDNHHTIACLAISLERVKQVFESYDLLTENVVFRKGWFKDTMQHVSDIEKISILRLDGDMYSSTIEVLEALYDKVQPGGFIIVDDWTLPGANKAVRDFLDSKNSSPEFILIDRNSAYWKK